MAIALPHVLMLWALRNTGFVGPGKSRSILEFGEQNWFGDVDIAIFENPAFSQALASR